MPAAVRTVEQPKTRLPKPKPPRSINQMKPHKDWHIVDDVFEEIRDSLQAFFKQSVPNAADVDDLMAQTRFKMEEFRSDWTPQVSTNTWIRAFARNVLRDYRRKFARRERACRDQFGAPTTQRRGEDAPKRLLQGGEPILENDWADDGDSSDGRPKEAALHEVLWSCISQMEELSTRHRTILALYLTNVSYDDLARCFGIPVKSVHKRQERGRERVAELVKRHPLNPEATDVSTGTALSKVESKLMRDIWNWIWSLRDAESNIARLLLFGKVGLRLIRRLGLPVTVDMNTVEMFESRLYELAKAKLKSPPA
ncbi:sigma-70 family RNA polymerase sigma factor [bacterium AH-315-F18]|nr:sigma-70 family RNA polymerase sigma factor [bacterium AH-315-F18]